MCSLYPDFSVCPGFSVVDSLSEDSVPLADPRDKSGYPVQIQVTRSFKFQPIRASLLIPFRESSSILAYPPCFLVSGLGMMENQHENGEFLWHYEL